MLFNLKEKIFIKIEFPKLQKLAWELYAIKNSHEPIEFKMIRVLNLMSPWHDRLKQIKRGVRSIKSEPIRMEFNKLILILENVGSGKFYWGVNNAKPGELVTFDDICLKGVCKLSNYKLSLLVQWKDEVRNIPHWDLKKDMKLNTYEVFWLASMNPIIKKQVSIIEIVKNLEKLI